MKPTPHQYEELELAEATGLRTADIGSHNDQEGKA
jgi:hypothetical protein